MVKTVRAVGAIRDSRDDRIFHVFVLIVINLLFLAVLYPMVYIVSSSFSSPGAINSGKVILWPVEFSVDGYRAVFGNGMVGVGYLNSVFYAVAGTGINLFLTLTAAYALSCAKLPGRKFLILMFLFTMLFGGGMIPNFILVRNLGILNTRWAMLLPGAIGIYNLIITRTFIMSSIPGELQEAAEIDGCSDIQYFWHCVIPLSKPIIAVITLFYAVDHWNSYFQAFLYLNDRTLVPLQIVLRDILIANTVDPSTLMDETLMAAKLGLADLIKYALIIVSSLPVMMIYPFIQKYFIKGVMIGSLKG